MKYQHNLIQRIRQVLPLVLFVGIFPVCADAGNGSDSGIMKPERRLKMEISGNTRWWVVWQNQSRNFERVTNIHPKKTALMGSAEMHFFATASLSENLNAGAFVRLEAGGNRGQPFDFWVPPGAPRDIPVNVSYVFMKGPWGNVSVGSQTGVVTRLHVAAPDVVGDAGMGGVFGGSTVTDLGLGRLGSEGTGIHTTTKLDTGNNSQKIVYFTPKISGLVTAVEYVFSGDRNSYRYNPGQVFYRDILGAAALYTRDIGKLRISLSARWISGELESSSDVAPTSPHYGGGNLLVPVDTGRVSLGSNAPSEAFRPWSEWNSGVLFHMGNVAFGGSFRRSIDGRQPGSLWSGNGQTWDAGVSYKYRMFSMSYVCLFSQMKDNLILPGKDQLLVHRMSGKYGIRPGLNLIGAAEVGSYNGQDPNNPAFHDQGWSVTSGMEVNF